ncbi:PREDICTED: thylakoid lumenal 17.4 kDa protein, chloroplastic-like [Populus euphratica]|uniref:Thylakoid lumenal 17.4 kDa protein, chloroplastic-like n=1 Tax=Populus euphratica TaxID=75702 RepID=A0AAJ6Y7B5_POPEU|nr:PREDICTED: thylakoid lumenal 17.4 kDa protein, chloroplastic-like [Populus euphratica]
MYALLRHGRQSSFSSKGPRFPINSRPPVTSQDLLFCIRDGTKSRESLFQFSKEINSVACGILAAWAVTAASPVIAANQRPPPLSTEPDRCEKALGGNTIGQANGVYDKPIDLRFCDYTNDKSKLEGKSLAAALTSDAKFDGADTSEVVVSKAYAVGASFKGNFSVQPSSIYLL